MILKPHQLILIHTKVWKKSTLKKYLHTLYQITFAVRTSTYLAHRSPGWQLWLDPARRFWFPLAQSLSAVRCWDSWGLAGVGCPQLTQLNSVRCGLSFPNSLAWVCSPGGWTKLQGIEGRGIQGLLRPRLEIGTLTCLLHSIGWIKSKVVLDSGGGKRTLPVGGKSCKIKLQSAWIQGGWRLWLFFFFWLFKCLTSKVL